MAEISIIVPVYNVEKMLHRCVESILAQTFTDFELILVDDGSTDRSGLICDEYGLLDSRVRVIHQNNRGASAARNTGIDVSNGHFIAFCDSDDIVSPMWLQRLFELTDCNTLVVGAYCCKSDHLGTPLQLRIEAGKKYPRNCYYDFNKVGLAGYLCNALYRSKIIQKYRIPLRENSENGDYNEDLLFALDYIKHVDYIVYTGYSDYYYNTHADSLSRGTSKNYFNKYAEKYAVWNRFILEECTDSESENRNLATETLYHFLTALSLNNKNIHELKRIVCSPAMSECLLQADTSRENPTELALIKKKRIMLLYIFYQMVKIKESIKER